jgi:hypothetical protein
MRLTHHMTRSCLSAAVLLLLLAPSARAANRTFTGVTRLTGYTNWQYKSITFDDQSVIVTNGFRLTLEGTANITFKGTPKIVSYKAPTEARGEAGRPAGQPEAGAPVGANTMKHRV